MLLYLPPQGAGLLHPGGCSLETLCLGMTRRRLAGSLHTPCAQSRPHHHHHASLLKILNKTGSLFGGVILVNFLNLLEKLLNLIKAQPILDARDPKGGKLATMHYVQELRYLDGKMKQ